MNRKLVAVGGNPAVRDNQTGNQVVQERSRIEQEIANHATDFGSDLWLQINAQQEKASISILFGDNSDLALAITLRDGLQVLQVALGAV